MTAYTLTNLSLVLYKIAILKLALMAVLGITQSLDLH